MAKSSDSSVKSVRTQMTHHKGARKISQEPPSSKEGPDDLNFVLLSLDYLRDLRRTNDADFLRNKKRVHPDYLSLAIFALSRSILRPDYLTNKNSPRDVFDSKFTSGSDHHKIPHISKITQEVLSPSNRPYDEDYDDLHPSNLYRFYRTNGIASGPEDGPLGLDELVRAGLKGMEGRCRLDAEREIVRSSHFEHYIQSVTKRGYFFDKMNSGKRKDPKEEEARKNRQVQVYKEKYRRAIAKYREKLALTVQNEEAGYNGGVNTDLLSAPGSPRKLQQNKAKAGNREGNGFHSPTRNEQVVGDNKDSSPVSPLTPNTAAPCSLAPSNMIGTGSHAPSTPGRARPNNGSTRGYSRTAGKQTPVPASRDSLLNSPNPYPQQSLNTTDNTATLKQKQSLGKAAEVTKQTSPPYQELSTNKGVSNNDLPKESSGKQKVAPETLGSPESPPPSKMAPKKKVLSPKIRKVRKVYEEKFASSSSSEEAKETKYEGPSLPEQNPANLSAQATKKKAGETRWNCPQTLSIPDITEPKPRSSPNANKNGRRAAAGTSKLRKSSPTLLSLRPIRSPRRSPKTSCTSPVARLRHEKKDPLCGLEDNENCSTPVTSPRRNKLSNDTSWITARREAAASNNAREEKQERRAFSFSSSALHGRLSPPTSLKLDPYQLDPPKCFSHLGAARIFTAQGVEWGSTANLSSPRSIRTSPRACNVNSPSSAVPVPRRGVC